VNPGYIPFFEHNFERDVALIGRANPSALKVYLYKMQDNGRWRRLREVAPNAFYLGVDVARSDSADLSNPRRDAEEGVKLLDTCPDAVRRLMGKNEMLKQGDTTEQVKRWVDYHVMFTRRCHELGTAVAVGAVNTGHPALLLFGDGKDQWPLVTALDNEMGSDDCWDLHEYWTAEGPLACWPWTTGRHLRCPTTHKILIGEFGYDAAVFAPEGTSNHGWGGKLPEDLYVDQAIQYHRMLTDPRLVGTCWFLLDFADKRWETFDVVGLLERVIARLGECATPRPEAVMPRRLTMPVPQSVRISQTFAEHQRSNPKGGWGLDISCVTGSRVLAAAAGVVDKADNDPEGYGLWVQINHRWGLTRYGHLSKHLVKRGDVVQAGDLIGLSGSTGNSTGPHVHFELIPMDDRSWPYRVDPGPFFGLGDEEPPASTPEPVQPATSLTSVRWNAEEAVREIERAIAQLTSTRTRLLDLVVTPLYEAEGKN
jgi:hypothetical protein